ncbi:MAG: HlyD family efflux transporter periplasmic adaptor subunit [Alphaproteobacteria bacterium]|nr:HlyD family efflux transporter periplasmic adaptor subunit [Alphaproteobacteria bacterium]
MELFRQEVFRSKAPRLHGTVNLAQPISWLAITLALTVVVTVVAVFFASASYTKSELATGSIAPEGGILEVVAPRAGRVELVAVREGDAVRRGALLARVRVEETAATGVGAQAGVVAAIENRDRTLRDQESSIRAAAGAERQGFDAQIESLRAELATLDVQIVAQRRLIAMAESELRLARDIGKRGFISRREIAGREEAFISRSQQLSSLEQNRAAKLGALRQQERAREEAGAKAAAAVSGLASSRADAQKEIAAAHAAQGFALLAPADGKVAALAVHPGDTVTPQASVLAIVPAGGRMVARLYVPGKAAGFVRIGQEVRLAFEAFPPERFGTLGGRIVGMSSAPVPQPGTGGAVTPVYVATAVLDRPNLTAYGRKAFLLPGMAFTARIVTERRSLLRWLFDPLYAGAAR